MLIKAIAKTIGNTVLHPAEQPIPKTPKNGTKKSYKLCRISTIAFKGIENKKMASTH